MNKGDGSYPDDLKYTREHEWISVQGNVGSIGITHYAQEELGDIVYVEVPKTGTPVVAGEEFGTVESVKAVSEIYAPVSGEVVATNPGLTEHPETINRDPYGEGWLIKIRLADLEDVKGLMSAAEYRKFIEDEAN